MCIRDSGDGDGGGDGNDAGDGDDSGDGDEYKYGDDVVDDIDADNMLVDVGLENELGYDWLPPVTPTSNDMIGCHQ